MRFRILHWSFALAALICLGKTEFAVAQDWEQSLFVEEPGVRELSGRLIVRPMSIAALMTTGISHPQAIDRLVVAKRRLDPWLIREDTSVRELIVKVPQGTTEHELALELLKTEDYEYVVPDWRVHALALPNDPLFDLQWHLPQIDAPLAWELTVGSPEVVIAICDSGIDLDHPDLQAVLVPGYNAVDELSQTQGGQVEGLTHHGTQVAGTAGAIGNNGVGVRGLAWNIGVMPVRVSNMPNDTALISDINRGARWAAENGARIVNVSFSGATLESVATTGEYIRSLDSIYVWAAGNANFHLGFLDPADVLIVGATDQSDAKATFSNFGDAIDLAAPGVDIWTTRLNGEFGTINGTSFSAPLTGALAALVWSIDQSFSSRAVEQILRDTAVDLGSPGEDDFFGSGRINAAAAVQLALEASAGNIPPSANCDRVINFQFEGLTIDVLANDLDINGDSVSIQSFESTTSSGATVELSKGTGPGGRDVLLYNPNPAFEGIDTFSYSISDPAGETDTASVEAGVIEGFEFATPLQYALPIGMRDIVLGDFNNDGNIDVAALKGTGFQAVTVLVNLGNGALSQTAIIDSETGGSWIASADFNGDQFDDLVFADSLFDRLTILFSDGQGSFGYEQSIDFSQAGPIVTRDHDGMPIDMNGDGHLDFVVIDEGTSRAVSVFVNDGLGNFNLHDQVEAGIFPKSVVATDFNNDGLTDIVVGNVGGNTLSLFAGTSNGSLIPWDEFLANLPPWELAAADSDGDGDIDLFVLNQGLLGTTPGVVVHENDSAGFFSVADLVDTGGEVPRDLATADFDLDGDVDLATVHQNSFTFGLVSNLGEHFFPAPQVEDSHGFVPKILLAGDLDNDGREDIVIGHTSVNYNVTIFLNQTPPQGVLVGDVNGDGDVNLLDVQPFVEILAEGSFQDEADINRDGAVDLLDVAPFVELLTGS